MIWIPSLLNPVSSLSVTSLFGSVPWRSAARRIDPLLHRNPSLSFTKVPVRQLFYANECCESHFLPPFKRAFGVYGDKKQTLSVSCPHLARTPRLCKKERVRSSSSCKILNTQRFPPLRTSRTTFSIAIPTWNVGSDVVGRLTKQRTYLEKKRTTTDPFLPVHFLCVVFVCVLCFNKRKEEKPYLACKKVRRSCHTAGLHAQSPRN